MEIEQLASSVQTQDGAAARINRAIGTRQLDYVDPFLLLDEFFVEPPAGFPEHPHRGFEIVTYMLKGAFEHQDSAGGRARIEPGGAQRILAGRGIAHSEAPGTKGLNYGLQLWLNIPLDQKRAEPVYQTVTAAELPVQSRDGVTIRTVLGPGSPLETLVDAVYYDVTLAAGAAWQETLAAGWNAFVYVLEGRVTAGGRGLEEKQVAVLSSEQEDRLSIASEDGARFVFAAGEPLHQPVRRWGPFVE